MRPARALALGLLHGPAELLPVSSSAHAALLLADLDGERRKEVEVALHAGTLLALGPPRRPRDLGWLALATAPPALAGLALERPIEQRLGTRPTLAAGLVAGAVALVLADRRGGARTGRPGVRDALWLGAAQATALVPGVSRHGAALSALRARGFTRPAAHALSREASKPVLAGATALKGWRVARRGEVDPALLAAAAGSTVSTALVARALAGRGVRAPLWPFAAYRAALAAVLAASVLRHDAWVRKA